MGEIDNNQEGNKQESEDLEMMFRKLDEVITELESDEISLEQSFVLYNQGIEAIKKCNDTIDGIEKKVQMIDKNGEYHEL